MQNVVYKENSLETQCPTFLLKAVNVDIFFLAFAQIPDFQKKSMYSA